MSGLLRRPQGRQVSLSKSMVLGAPSGFDFAGHVGHYNVQVDGFIYSHSFPIIVVLPFVLACTFLFVFCCTCTIH